MFVSCSCSLQVWTEFDGADEDGGEALCLEEALGKLMMQGEAEAAAKERKAVKRATKRVEAAERRALRLFCSASTASTGDCSSNGSSSSSSSDSESSNSSSSEESGQSGGSKGSCVLHSTCTVADNLL